MQLTTTFSSQGLPRGTSFRSNSPASAFLLRAGLLLLTCLLMSGLALTQSTYYVTTSGNDANAGTSWANAFRTVQTALATAGVSGDQIWVAEGTYYPDEGGGQVANNRSASFVLK